MSPEYSRNLSQWTARQWPIGQWSVRQRRLVNGRLVNGRLVKGGGQRAASQRRWSKEVKRSNLQANQRRLSGVTSKPVKGG